MDKYYNIESVRALEDEAYKLFNTIIKVYSGKAPEVEITEEYHQAILECVCAMYDCSYAMDQMYKKRKQKNPLKCARKAFRGW